MSRPTFRPGSTAGSSSRSGRRAAAHDHHPGRPDRGRGPRSGEEFAVVAADGSLPLPPHVAEILPPGTLVRVTDTDGEIRLRPAGSADPRENR
jgi:hypothetical protein